MTHVYTNMNFHGDPPANNTWRALNVREIEKLIYWKSCSFLSLTLQALRALFDGRSLRKFISV